MVRPTIPTDTVTEVLIRSGRRCCLCFGLNNDFEVKQGQIAHLDQNSQNSSPGNLAFLCLSHHDAYDSRTSQSKGLTLEEVKAYGEALYAHIQALVSQKQVSPKASYSREEFEEAIIYHTGTHRSQSVVELLREARNTFDAINTFVLPSDPEWTKSILQSVIDHGWVRRLPTNHQYFELTLNGRRMLEVLDQIPEPIKESAWREIWLVGS